jgi:Na+/H+ antiporter NhaC
MVLVLAWAISQVSKDVGAGHYVASLAQGVLSAEYVPVIAFIAAGAIAFATGTSYGTMAILMPILLPLAFTLSATGGSASDLIGLATTAAILGGSVFGDHCSPISDTTVLSSMACGADHIDHVRTQLPYALLVAGVSLPCYVMIGYGWAWWIVLPLGAVAIAALFFALSSRTASSSHDGI